MRSAMVLGDDALHRHGIHRRQIGGADALDEGQAIGEVAIEWHVVFPSSLLGSHQPVC
jgi:hypothetical protein